MSRGKVSFRYNFLKKLCISPKHLFSGLKKLRLCDTFTDKEYMELNGEYMTIAEMAKSLGITYLTAKQRLLRAAIKPISGEALYPASALEAIRNVPGKGRPKKNKG
jgi:hypothetical protein